MVTVDLPLLGLRERDVALGYMLPMGLPVPTVEAAAGARTTIAETIGLIEPRLTWEDVERLATGRCRCW